MSSVCPWEMLAYVPMSIFEFPKIRVYWSSCYLYLKSYILPKMNAMNVFKYIAEHYSEICGFKVRLLFNKGFWKYCIIIIIITIIIIIIIT